jgi:thioredoxin 1
VLVIFGANWCYDCHVLDTALHSPDFAFMMAQYEVVNVNVGEMGQDNLDLAKKLGVDTSKGVPSLAVLDAQGKVLVAQTQGEFEDTRTLAGTALTGFLKTWAGQ